jgi:hypothetical protein
LRIKFDACDPSDSSACTTTTHRRDEIFDKCDHLIAICKYIKIDYEI